MDGDQAIGTEQGGGFGVAEHKFLGGGGEVVHLLSVDGVDNVAVLETLVKHHLAVFVAEAGVAQGQFVGAPVREDGCIDEKGRDEVDQHAAGDDAETLPTGFGAVFPRLGCALEVFGILGFVNHACNVAVAAQGYPAQAPKGVVLVFGTQVGFSSHDSGVFALKKRKCHLPSNFLAFMMENFQLKKT